MLCMDKPHNGLWCKSKGKAGLSWNEKHVKYRTLQTEQLELWILQVLPEWDCKLPLCSVSSSSVRRCYPDWRFLPQAFLMQSPHSFPQNSSCLFSCSMMVFLIMGSVPLGWGGEPPADVPRPSGTGPAWQGCWQGHMALLGPHFCNFVFELLKDSWVNTIWSQWIYGNQTCLLGLRWLCVYFKFLPPFWPIYCKGIGSQKVPIGFDREKSVQGN